uniref:interferon omega-1-like n=1 Tax=Jaculus jaculus TaxID=51337 RepID=UPI001E1B2734|nr:interferon omega-1-like [Jaculus jaculus]
MALLLPLLAAMVVCSYGSVSSLGCDLPHNSVLPSRRTFDLLDQMRRVSPFLCLKDRRDFRLSPGMVDGGQSHKVQAMSVVHQMLQQTLSLFHTERSSAAWSAPLLHELRTELHQQLELLDNCLEQVMVEEPSALIAGDPSVALRKYFQRIRLYLEEKKYSDCAWEIVRVEILRAISSVAKLQERLSQDGHLGSS